MWRIFDTRHQVLVWLYCVQKSCQLNAFFDDAVEFCSIDDSGLKIDHIWRQKSSRKDLKKGR